MKQKITLTVNGEIYELEVEPWWTLLDVLREKLFLTGTKKGCDHGDCGSCTVLIDGKAKLSCLTLAVEGHGKDISTIEGIAKGRVLHPIQQAFVEHGAIQCGFCTPGMVLAAKALLDKNPRPTEDEIKEGLSGNLCRCTGYVKIVNAVMASSEKIVTEREKER